MNDLTHIDLYSGIGGFSLAAEACGLRTVAFCEIDPRCRAFLGKAWPGVPQHADIRTFNGREWGGAYLLTAGTPCQPASRAGKQGGANDDRWLWHETIRVLDESRPTWALLENPLGILDVGIDGILSDVERCGYETQPIIIPACAVNSPQQRKRVWILCRRKEGVSLADAFCERGRGGSMETGIGYAGNAGPSGQEHLEDAASGQRQPRAEETGNDTPPETAGNHAHGPMQDVGVGLADTDQPGRQGTNTEPGTHGLRAEHCEGDVAHPTRRGLGIDRSAPGNAGYADERNKGGMGNAKCGGEQRRSMQARGAPGTHAGSDRSVASGPWERFVWLPCADGKLRRAPDDSQRMAHGLPVELLEALGTPGRRTPKECEVHRSLLAALGNSIVWQVAAQIIKAMVQAEEE